MAIGQGGYKGNLDEIMDALGPQSGGGEFVDNYMNAPVSEAEIKETAALETQARSNQWGNVGTSIMDWLGETAFKGSQNPTGVVQETLGAVSYPFAKTAEVAIDYVNPWSRKDEQGRPAGYMHSEQIPDWLSFLNENQRLRTGLAKNPALALAPALLSGFAYPINEWAEGRDVTKGALTGGVLSLTGPVAGLTARGVGKVAQKMVPDLTDEMVDQTKRGLLKAVGVGTGLIATPYLATKAILRKGGKTKVAKLGVAAMGKIALITHRLEDTISNALRTVIKQQPLNTNQAMKVTPGTDPIYPDVSVGGTRVTEELGYQPGVIFQRTLEMSDNKNVVDFLRAVIRNDNKTRIKVLNEMPEEVLLKREGVLTNLRRHEIQDETLYAINRGSPEGDIPFYDDVTQSIAHNLDDVFRSGQLSRTKSYLHEDASPAYIREKDYLDYHENAIGRVATAHDDVLYGTTLIEHLAETNPEQLVNILRNVIKQSEENLSKVAGKSGFYIEKFEGGHIDRVGMPVRVVKEAEEFNIKIAKELLEVLQ